MVAILHWRRKILLV